MIGTLAHWDSAPGDRGSVVDMDRESPSNNNEVEVLMVQIVGCEERKAKKKAEREKNKHNRDDK